MSLPFRHATAEDYLQDTIEKLQAAQPDFTHLKIGNYSTQGLLLNWLAPSPTTSARHPQRQLDTVQLTTLLDHGTRNPNLKELTFCNVDINNSCTTDHDDDSSTRIAVLDHLVGLFTNGTSCADGRRNWKKISLTACGYGVGSGIGIIQALGIASPNDMSVDTIHIANCNMNSTDYRHLGRFIQHNTSLIRLTLIEQDMTKERTQVEDVVAVEAPNQEQSNHWLYQGLASKSCSLERLDLSFCEIESQFPLDYDLTITRSIAQGIARNQSLLVLNLSGCELDDHHICGLVRYGLLHHPRIHTLTLSRNNCADTGLDALSTLLHCNVQDGDNDSSNNAPTKSLCPLEVLDLSNQHFERDDDSKLCLTDAFGLSLTSNRTLTSLNLSFNKLVDSDVFYLANALSHNRTLQILDLRSNRIGDAGVVALSSTLNGKDDSDTPNNNILGASSCGLVKLFLFGNPFGEVGAEALYKAIQCNTTVVTLNLHYNSCFYDAIQYYACLNLAGRKLLQHRDAVPPGLWSHVLSRAGRVSRVSRGTCRESDIIYHMVRHGADMFVV